MRNITPNSRKAYWILLEYQINHSDEAGNRGIVGSLKLSRLQPIAHNKTRSDFDASFANQGMRFNEYLGLCQENFAAHDETRLRTHMKEFFDHKLMAAKTVGIPIWTDATFAPPSLALCSLFSALFCDTLSTMALNI